MPTRFTITNEGNTIEVFRYAKGVCVSFNGNRVLLTRDDAFSLVHAVRHVAKEIRKDGE